MTQHLDVADSEIRDDVVVPFRTEASGIIGRLVRLGPAVDAILNRHDFPEPVAEVMGEAMALTAILGAGLKFDGKLILQTRSDGPLGFIVTNYQTPGRLRGYASYDAGQIPTGGDVAERDHGALIGSGHLALTIDQGRDMDRYQGIVALAGTTLSEAARDYFRQSEQLPTFIRLVVARHQVPGASGEDGGWRWRAGGIMVQHVSPEGGKPPPKNAPADFLLGDDDENWQRVNMLAATVEDHELVDPSLAPERLLFRLFNEEGVRVFEDHPVSDYCQCSRDRVSAFLNSFEAEELDEMRNDDGDVAVTCEFCGTQYVFDRPGAGLPE